MLIGFSLLILGVLTLFSMILGTNLIGTTLSGDVSQDLIVNGTTSTLEFTGQEGLFIIDPTVATIAIFIVIIGIAAVLGIQVVGSGLSEESVKTIMSCILYGAIWGLLSVFAMPLIISIEIFGTIIYMVLLMLYVIGVIEKITGGNS